jgi:lactate dehydrogenase-like 2-hydroxyacid dehydrogenase
MKPKVYVTRIVPEAGLAMLRGACEVEVWEGEFPVPRDLLLEKVRDAEGLYSLLTERVNAELLDAAPHLKVVSNMAVGYDNVDVAACTGRGIPVGNTPDVLTEATADLTFALLMAAARRIPGGVDFVRDGKWHTWEPLGLLGVEVWGTTLGIVGLGRIGVAVARRAQGFAMRVLYHDLAPRPDLEEELGVEYAAMDDLLAESDFVSLHCPLLPETHHLVNEGALRRMKSTAILINAARGQVVDPDALVRALREGWIAAAALDVTDPEPIAADHPLVGLSNCIVVPHIGSATVLTRNRMATRAAENLLAGLRGERLPYCVNPEVYG